MYGFPTTRRKSAGEMPSPLNSGSSTPSLEMGDSEGEREGQGRRALVLREGPELGLEEYLGTKTREVGGERPLVAMLDLVRFCHF